MQNAISTLNILPTTKDEIKNFTSMFLNELKSGNLDKSEIVRTAIKLKAVEKTVKDILEQKEYKRIMLESFQEIKGYDFGNAKVEEAEVGTSYNYSSTNDSELFDMEKEFKELKDKIEKRKDFLKTISSEVYGSDGVQLFAPIKSSTSSIKITLK